MLQYLIPADVIIHIISRGVKKELRLEVKKKKKNELKLMMIPTTAW